MSRSRPLVSVVIPTHNRASLVGRAIGSVLAQTQRDLEVLVIDDRSTDRTEEIVMAIPDRRVRYLRTPARLGAAEARNLGIRHADGRFVAFLDDDDQWLERKLERQLAEFDRPAPPALVYSGMWIERRGRRRYGVVRPGDDPFGTFLALPGPVTTSGFLVDARTSADELAFDPTVVAFEDSDLLIRISRRWPVVLVPEPLYVWYDHGDHPYREPRRFLRGRRRILEKHAADLSTRPSIAAHLHFRVAMAERRAGNPEGVRSALLAASTADPSNGRLRLLAAAARLGPGSASAALGGYRVLGAGRRALRPAGPRRVGVGR
jgi:glycosyltransferase involved in cell wall biosynthesis